MPKPYNDVVVDPDRLCTQCRFAQPRNREGEIHSFDCSKHNPETCLACLNLKWMEEHRDDIPSCL